MMRTQAELSMTYEDQAACLRLLAEAGHLAFTDVEGSRLCVTILSMTRPAVRLWSIEEVQTWVETHRRGES